MSPAIQKLHQSSIVRFAGVGALSTLIDFAVLNILLQIGATVYVAGGLGFFAGFTNGYFFNSRYVFKKASADRYIKYLLISVGGLLITELLLHVFHVNLELSANMAKVIAVIVVFFWNYSLSKLWAFA